MGVQQAVWMDAEAYLAWEGEQQEKHEYFRGEVFAMVGASDGHVTITLNVASALREHLRGGPCRSFISDMKLRVEAADAFFYPDVMVTCDEADRARGLYKAAPVLVVEVLSPGTEAFDRGAKFAAYRLLPSLREYLLIDPITGALDLYRRDPENHWVLHPHSPHERVELQSVALSLTGARIFEDAPPGPSSDESA
ncbi:Uma2 family endonuclease [Thioalkalivibrio nitratireducens]